jgi:hypothetical protein
MNCYVGYHTEGSVPCAVATHTSIPLTLIAYISVCFFVCYHFVVLQEAELFRSWMEDVEARAAAMAAAREKQEEEDAEVGPQLPGEGIAKAAKGNLGGFLLPGEGDR